MKKNIEQQFPDENNIKLCRGGIRDIEFITQAFQLINGGNINELHTGNSLIGLKILNQLHLINDKEYQLLSSSYIFYRKIEHFLQLDNDKQTHSIPLEIESQQKLASFLGFNSVEDLLNNINRKKESVANLFNSITSGKRSDKSQNVNIDSVIFNNKRRADSNYDFLKRGQSSVGKKSFDNKTISLFNSIEQNLIEYLSSASDPDKVLENFAKVLRNILFPSILYNEFQNKKFFDVFLKICEYSQKCIDMMSVDKSLVDFFLTRQVFAKLNEARISELNISKFIFSLAAQSSLKLISFHKSSILISEFLSQKIKKIIEANKIDCEYFVGAMGSFGTMEMNFSSDTDLIFISNNVSNTFKVQKSFEDLIKKIDEEIYPFKTDLRLRPEGSKGPLVWDLSKLSSYFATRARVWEYQSLNKLRFLCGDKSIYENLVKLICKYSAELDPGFVRKEIGQMKLQLKQSIMMIADVIDLKNEYGGINDINFYLDSVILPDKKLFRKTIGKSRKDLLKLTETPSEIVETYKLLKEAELAAQVIYNSSNSKLNITASSKILLSKYFVSESVKFEEHLKNLLFESNKKIISLQKKTEPG